LAKEGKKKKKKSSTPDMNAREETEQAGRGGRRYETPTKLP